MCAGRTRQGITHILACLGDQRSLGLYWITAMLIALSVNGSEPERRNFVIEAGSAETTLRQAAIEAEVEILYDLSTVQGLTTQPIEGSFTPFEALEAMLADTFCRVVAVHNGRAYAIVREPSADTSEASDNGDSPVNKEGSPSDEASGWLERLTRGLSAAVGADGTRERDGGDDSIFELTPFEIEASEEAGYLATSSLAGTRIQGNLSDIGASISVHTEAFMEDLSITDSETLLLYGLNTEVGGFRGNFVNPSSEGVETTNLREPQSNTRVRGLTRADNTLNYYRTDVPWDSYIIRRIDIQRGANSVLFGLGSPAGIINATPIEAEFMDLTRMRLRVDNHGSMRANLDFNRSLLEDSLAVRIALLNEQQKFQQRPAFEDKERGYATLTWKPEAWNQGSRSFQIRASVEIGNTRSNRPRMMVPVDYLSMWLAPTSASGFEGEFSEVGDFGLNQTPWDQYDDFLSGSGEPNQNPWTTTFFDGVSPVILFDGATIGHITERGSNDRGSWFFDSEMAAAGATEALRNDGSASLDGTSVHRHIKHPEQRSLNGLQRAAIESNLPFAGFWKDRSIANTEVFDFFNNLIDGDSKREFRNWELWQLDLAQTFFHDRVGYSFSAFSQHYDAEDYAALGVLSPPALSVDVGLWDRTSQPNARVPNPRVGRVMVRSENPGGSSLNRDRKSLRAQGFVRLDFARSHDALWRKALGAHEWLAVMQTRKLDEQSSIFQLLGMGRDFLLERGENVWPLHQIPAEGSRFSEYNRTLGEIRPSTIFYLHFRPDYTGIHRVAASLNDLPYGLVSIAGFDATPLPGLDAHTAALPWTGSPFASEQLNQEIRRFQASNPEYYRGWVDSIGTYTIANAYRSEADREYLTTTRNYFSETVDSTAAVWTGRWLEGSIVGMLGWREDHVTEKWYEHDFRTDGPQIDVRANENSRSTRVSSQNSSLKLNLSSLLKWSESLPFDVHLLHARGEVQTPDPTRVDVFGRTLPNSRGSTEDTSIMLTSADNRWSMRATYYQTEVKDAVSGSSLNSQKFRIQQVLQQGAVRAGYIESHSQNYTADWLSLSASAANAGYATEADYRREVMAPAWRAFERHLWEQFPITRAWYQSDFEPGDQNPPVVLFPDNATLVEDTRSAGWEIEWIGNLSSNWNLALNLSKTRASRDNLPGAEFQAVTDYIAEALQGPAGELPIWWYDGPGMATHLAPFLGELAKAKALNGSAQPEIREWKGSVVSNYQFRSGRWTGFGIGVGYRYEDSQIFAYGLSLDESGNTVVNLEETYRDDSRHTVDLWFSYTRSLTHSIDWKIQLNVFNAFGNNETVPLHRNPDGSMGLLGIREGMSWALTHTLRF